jgi:hypothetical protein
MLELIKFFLSKKHELERRESYLAGFTTTLLLSLVMEHGAIRTHQTM